VDREEAEMGKGRVRGKGGEMGREEKGGREGDGEEGRRMSYRGSRGEGKTEGKI